MQEACDELTRELGVRGRLKDRWVKEGKWTVTEARERIGRQKMALDLCLAILEAMENRPGMMVLALGCLLLLGATGCQSMPSMVHELAGDTNQVDVVVTTPWGRAELHRNTVGGAR